MTLGLLPGAGRNRRILLSPHDNYEAAVGSLLVKQANGKWGALATPLDVPHGGLGVATLTAHGVLIGEGTNAVAASSAGTAGQLFTSGGASADGAYSSPFQSAEVTTDQSTTSTSYTDLATAGPAVTLTLKGTTAIVFLSASTYKSPAGSGNTSFVSVAVSGASTVAAADTAAQGTNPFGSSFVAAYPLSGIVFLTGLTAGSNTFTMKYKVDGATFHFDNRTIAVFAP